MRDFAIAGLLLIGSPALAQQPTPELQALDDALPGTLINDPSKLDWSIYGAGQTSKSVKSPDIPGGGAAVRITIPSLGATHFAVGANVPLSAPLVAGRDYVVAFYARTISTDTPDGKGRIGVRFQQNSSPYPGFGDRMLTIGSEWKLYEVTARADKSIAKDVALVAFQLSGAKQVVEIGQTIVVEGATSIQTTTAAAPAAPDPELPPQLVGKGVLLNDPASRTWGSHGATLTSKATVTNVYGRVGTLFTIAAAGANVYDAGTAIPLSGAVAEDDVLTIAVLARTVSAKTADGQGVMTVRVQENVAPYAGFADKMLQIGPNWRLYQIRTAAPQALAAGKGQIALQLAGAEQSIEVGPVYVIRETPKETP